MLMAEAAETDLGFQTNVIGKWGIWGMWGIWGIWGMWGMWGMWGTPAEILVADATTCDDALASMATRSCSSSLRATKGDPNGDAGCAAVWAALKPKW